MSEIVESFTGDEKTVLEICNSGEVIAEIGRWEKPVKDLERRGYLAGPAFNKYITDAGRAAFQGAEREYDRQLGKAIEAGGRIAAAQQEVASLVEQAAALMATAALKTHEIRGDAPEVALDLWIDQMKQEALNRIREHQRNAG